MTALITAFQFLSIFPTIIKRPFTAREMGKAVAWFPLVGAVLGGGLYFFAHLEERVFSTEIVAALTVAGWILLTRAFHLDGLMDTCDGLFGGFSVERRLEIMKDSRMGAFGVAAGVLLVLLKYAALVSISARDWMPALVISASLGRWASPLVIFSFPYARKAGTGHAMKENVYGREIIAASGIALVTVWFFAARFGLILMGSSAVLAFSLAFYFMRLLNGLTGDTYGAVTELTEVFVLLVFAAR